MFETDRRAEPIPIEHRRDTTHYTQQQHQPSVRNLHLSEAIWGPDAAEYRPERWEGAMEGGLPKGVPQGAYIVSQSWMGWIGPLDKAADRQGPKRPTPSNHNTPQTPAYT